MAPRQQSDKKEGKRNTVVERLEDVNSRSMTFLKRKTGLFNKLTELSIMCNAETALVISSPNGKFHVCGYPSAEAVVNRYVSGSRPPRGGRMGSFHEKSETLRARYEAKQGELNELKRKLAEMTEEQKQTGGGALSSLWWETPIDDMDLDGIEQFKKSVEMLKLNVEMRRVRNKNFPTPPPQQNPHLQSFAVENNGPSLPPNHPHLEPLSGVLCPKQPEQYRWQQVQSGSRFESGESSGLSSDDLLPFPPSNFDYDGGVMVPFDSSGSSDLPPFPPSNLGYDGGAMVNPFGSSGSSDLPPFPPSNFAYDGGAMVNPFGLSGSSDLPPFPPSNIGYDGGAMVNPFGSSGSSDLPPFPPSNLGYDGGAMVNPFGSTGSSDLPPFPPSNIA